MRSRPSKPITRRWRRTASCWMTPSRSQSSLSAAEILKSAPMRRGHSAPLASKQDPRCRPMSSRAFLRWSTRAKEAASDPIKSTRDKDEARSVLLRRGSARAATSPRPSPRRIAKAPTSRSARSQARDRRLLLACPCTYSRNARLIRVCEFESRRARHFGIRYWRRIPPISRSKRRRSLLEPPLRRLIYVRHCRMYLHAHGHRNSRLSGFSGRRANRRR